MISSSRWATCLFVIAACLSVERTRADTGPTDKDPAALFAVRKQADLDSWRADAAKNLEFALRGLDELEKPAGAAKAPVIVARVGQTHVALLRADRAAERLLVWSEVAGVDLKFRVEAARARLTELIAQLVKNRDIKARVDADLQNFGILLKRISKERINKVVKAQQNQSWEEADEALFEIRETLEPTIVWHRYSDLQPAMVPYDKKYEQIKVPRDVARRKLAATQLTALARQSTPDFAAIATRVADAVKSVGTSGQAVVNKDSVAGPQAMLELLVLWQETQAAALRARALDWARLEVDEQARTELNQLEAADAELVRTMREQMVALIVADTARLMPAEVEPRYKAWLSAAATVSTATSDAELQKALSEALDHLAAKAPDLETEVKQYHQSSDDLLKWRERTVQSYVRYHAGNSPALVKRFHEAAAAEGKSPGFMPPQDTGSVVLLAAAPLVIPTLAEKMIGTTVIVEHVFPQVGFAGAEKANAPVAVSDYQHRVYAEISVMPDLQAAAAVLRSELAPAASLDPLTLDAATALMAAERGAVELVGGKLTGLQLEGLVPRMAAVNSTDLLARPESLPADAVVKAPEQLVIRFTLEPAWAAGRYFIVAHP